MDREYLVTKITATKALIDAYEVAVLAFANDGAIQSYIIDTGQSRTNVTHADLPGITRLVDSLYNRLATLEARVYGSSSTMRPDW